MIRLCRRARLERLQRTFVKTIGENNPLYPDTREEFSYLKANYADKLTNRPISYGSTYANSFVKSMKRKREAMRSSIVDYKSHRNSWGSTGKEN